MQEYGNPTPITSFGARQCAAEILAAVLDEKRPLDEALARHSGLAVLSPRDRAFARLLIMTVLRRLGQIDAVLARMLEKPLTGRTNTVMHCLRLGVAQLLWLQTPPHAAVSETVDAVAALGHDRMKGLANAVLKRVARDGAGLVASQDIRINIPADIYTGWKKAFGADAARAIAEAALNEPPLDISVARDAEGWAERLGGTLLPAGSIRVTQAGKVEDLPGYGEGAWWVQDAAAALPVKLLGDVRGKTVLDLCAAPGGKTAQLAAAGAQVTAVDKSKRRLDILQANMARLKSQVTLHEADIFKFKPEQDYDIVLLDAPCSATGTLRRHPEVLRHKAKTDIAELAEKQRRLLNRTAAWVKPGGLLLYCVCSLQTEEGEEQAKHFLNLHRKFQVYPLPDAVSSLGFTAQDGAIRTHPGLWAERGGMDGFYVICLQRLNNI